MMLACAAFLTLRTREERIAPESAPAPESGFVHRNILAALGIIALSLVISAIFNPVRENFAGRNEVKRGDSEALSCQASRLQIMAGNERDWPKPVPEGGAPSPRIRAEPRMGKASKASAARGCRLTKKALGANDSRARCNFFRLS
jgi:hypothetical protein